MSSRNLLIYFPLGFLLVLNFFSIIFVSVSGSANIYQTISSDLIVNGTTTTIDYPETTASFEFDPLLGALVWIIVLTALATVLGLTVLGSGLGTFSVKTVVIVTFYVTSYVFFGLTAFPFVQAIPLFWGEALFIFMSILYAFGVGGIVGEDSS